MLLLIVALVLGFLAAQKNLLPSFLRGKMSLISTSALVLLLFSMGLSMGSDEGIVASLPILGWKAMVLSLSSIVGSVLLVWAGMRRFAVSAGKGGRSDDASDFR